METFAVNISWNNGGLEGVFASDFFSAAFNLK